jgi:uncharacterized protein
METQATAAAPALGDSSQFGPSKWRLPLLIAIVVIGIVALYGIQLVVAVVALAIFIASHVGFATNPALLAKLHAQDPATLNQIFPASTLAITVGIAEIAMAGVGFLLVRSFFGAGAKQLGIGRPLTPSLVGIGLIVGFALWAASAVIGEAQARLFGDHPQIVEQIFALHRDTASIAFDFLSACVIAPFCEEFFFRGIIFAGLAQRMPVLVAAIASGALFALAHLDQWAFVPLAVIGVGLAYSYYYTKSLWPNVIAHFTVNTTSLFLIHAFPQLAK